jgi:pheromone a factor receptor
MRRRLFYMSAAVLMPYAPMVMVLLAQNIIINMPWPIPYDFGALHDPEHWNQLHYITSDMVTFYDLNFNYLPILATVAIFWAFGWTKEAVNTYRRYLLAVGLGH